MNCLDRFLSSSWTVVICVYVSMMFIACSNKTDKEVQGHDSITVPTNVDSVKTVDGTDDVSLTKEEIEKQQKDEIVERIKEIYAAVKKRRTSDISASLEELYTTRGWREAIKSVTDKDAKSDDEIGFFDFDYWSMSQDDGDLKVKNVKVVNIDVEKGTAIVTVELHNYGSVTPVELEMRYEDNSWRIHNFNNLLQEMKDYVKGN